MKYLILLLLISCTHVPRITNYEQTANIREYVFESKADCFEHIYEMKRKYGDLFDFGCEYVPEENDYYKNYYEDKYL